MNEYLADEIFDKLYDIGAMNLGQGEKMENLGRGMVIVECSKIEVEDNDDCIRVTKYLHVAWQCDDSPVFKFISSPGQAKIVDKVASDCTTLPDGRIAEVTC